MILQLAVGYALHSFQDQHGEIFLHNFWDLTSILSKKLGKPYKIKAKDINKSDINDIKKIITALQSGPFSYESKWILNNSIEVIHTFEIHDMGLRHTLDFKNKSL